MNVPGGALRGTSGFGEAALGVQVYNSRPGNLELGSAWSGCMSFPQETPLLQCSPRLPMRAGQAAPPQSRYIAPTHIWPWSHVQSWCAQVCVYFCSQECPEQEPTFVDGPVVSEASLVAQTVKNPPAMQENLGLIPGLGRSPGEGNSYPLQYSGLENSMDRGAWLAIVHGVTESDMSK